MSNPDTNTRNRKIEKHDLNRDPLTGTPGAHPLGVAAGASAGAAAGAGIGSIVPGVGTAIGAVVGGAVGAIGGGLVGKGIAEAVNPTVEEAYWRDNFATRPYAKGTTAGYDDYAPAYRYGWESRMQYPEEAFETIEPNLQNGWNAARGASTLDWEQARHASRDAWERIERNSDRTTDDTVDERVKH